MADVSLYALHCTTTGIFCIDIVLICKSRILSHSGSVKSDSTTTSINSCCILYSLHVIIFCVYVLDVQEQFCFGEEIANTNY